MLSSWPLKVIESSLGSFDECSAAHKRLSTLRPSHRTWAVSPPEGSYRLQPPSPFIIITQPESWYSFNVPRRIEGWVDLGTAGKVHTARAQGCKSQWLCDKHNCAQRDSIPGPRALQSDMLPHVVSCSGIGAAMLLVDLGLISCWLVDIAALLYIYNNCACRCMASVGNVH